MRFGAEWRLMGAAYACLGALALTGCVSSPDRSNAFTFTTPAARNAQLALTGLMAVDTAQTVTIANSPCLREANPIAAAVFGSDRPSQKTVLLTNALYITGHWVLGSYLDRKANQPVDLSIDADADIAKRKGWQTLQRVYQFVTGLGHGIAVARNTALGIKPFSTFDCK